MPKGSRDGELQLREFWGKVKVLTEPQANALGIGRLELSGGDVAVSDLELMHYYLLCHESGIDFRMCAL